MTYAEGGTISYANGKRIHTFEDSGQLVVTEAGLSDSLVVAGGAAGGGDYSHTNTAFGGGAGGGVISTTGLTLGVGNVDVVVGEGGIPMLASPLSGGVIVDAENSSISDGNVNFTTQTAIRGGTFGQDGGSGGGEGGTGSPGTGTVGQGHDGGNVTNFFTGAGGGGGAGGAGGDAPATDFTDTAGSGGPGILSSISGTALRYGAGGGGGAWMDGYGAGGLGGGGDGGANNEAGKAGTFYGAGGGGQGGTTPATRTGGAGHKGVVIFSYAYGDNSGRRVAQNEDLADMAASTIKGRITSTGIPQDLNASEVAGILAAHFQPLDSDLTSIAGLSPSNDDIIQRKAGAWVNRTVSQLVTDIRAVTDSVYGLQSGTLAQFAATTSLELKGVISDETGSGALVFANTPTLISPVISNFFWANHTHAASGVTGGTLASATGLPLTTGVTGILPAANGGTGVNNSTRTLTISTNGGTIDFSAAASTLTVPESMTAAGRNVANTFTANQTINARVDTSLSYTTTGTVGDDRLYEISGTVTSDTAASARYPRAVFGQLTTAGAVGWNSASELIAFQGQTVINVAVAHPIVMGMLGRVTLNNFAATFTSATALQGHLNHLSGTPTGTSEAGVESKISGVVNTTTVHHFLGSQASLTPTGIVNYYGLYLPDISGASTINNAIKTGAGLVVFGDDVSSTGSFLSSHATKGIGYATGAGGTVTQATNKATGVTLNKVTGLITMNNAALAADTTVTFTLTSSAIVATDTIILRHVSGGTAGSYLLNAQAAAGSATINVRNITASSLSEAIVIRYTVIKSVSA